MKAPAEGDTGLMGPGADRQTSNNRAVQFQWIIDNLIIWWTLGLILFYSTQLTSLDIHAVLLVDELYGHTHLAAGAVYQEIHSQRVLGD